MSSHGFFDRNTYLQVTATPQALFPSDPGHIFRPQFTVLSHPGADYVGGDDFFGEKSELVREFSTSTDIIVSRPARNRPRHRNTGLAPPRLGYFMVGAAYKRSRDADQNCAFLCHVSTKTSDHSISSIFPSIQDRLTGRHQGAVRGRHAAAEGEAYEDLAATHLGVKVARFRRAASRDRVLLAGHSREAGNGQTDEDVAVISPYNLFVGGNKLGRGVTIKNLLVSYYGRIPKRPQADTVLQHARMYGYRRQDIGLLRLYLPAEFHGVFKAIHKMERGLRELITRRPTEQFRGIYLEGRLSGTRKSVLAPDFDRRVLRRR